MNYGFKAALIKKFGSQTAAARALGISESRLSRMIRGWDTPRPDELETLSRILGKGTTHQFLKGSFRAEHR